MVGTYMTADLAEDHIHVQAGKLENFHHFYHRLWPRHFLRCAHNMKSGVVRFWVFLSKIGVETS